jgi:hypothetical protein
MRVVVTLRMGASSHAELATELARLPVRERAKRLRLLASLGLVMIRGGVGVPAPETSPTPEKVPETAAGRRFRSLRARLQSTLD